MCTCALIMIEGVGSTQVEEYDKVMGVLVSQLNNLTINIFEVEN